MAPYRQFILCDEFKGTGGDKVNEFPLANIRIAGKVTARLRQLQPSAVGAFFDLCFIVLLRFLGRFSVVVENSAFFVLFGVIREEERFRKDVRIVNEVRMALNDGAEMFLHMGARVVAPPRLAVIELLFGIICQCGGDALAFCLGVALVNCGYPEFSLFLIQLFLLVGHERC